MTFATQETHWSRRFSEVTLPPSAVISLVSSRTRTNFCYFLAGDNTTPQARQYLVAFYGGITTFGRGFIRTGEHLLKDGCGLWALARRLGVNIKQMIVMVTLVNLLTCIPILLVTLYTY